VIVRREWRAVRWLTDYVEGMAREISAAKGLPAFIAQQAAAQQVWATRD